MKAATWGIVLIVMGLIGMAFIGIFEDITSTNDQSYYLVKEVTEAAMYDSIDLGYYRLNGKVKIDGEKFMENFVRRFSESVNIRKSYDIKFHDIVELPPKVSLSVGSKTYVTFTGEDFDIINNIDAIIESRY
ncbi:MAG: DUF5411 family protein [Bacilli bacterium]|nr:DUF5411 family protein [Bacilli bacterium]